MLLLHAGCPGVQICDEQLNVLGLQYVPAVHERYRLLDIPSTEQRSTSLPLQKYVLGTHFLVTQAPLTQNRPERLQSVVLTTLSPSVEQTMRDVFWHSVAPGVHVHCLHCAVPPAPAHVNPEAHGRGVADALPFSLHMTTALLTHCWVP